VSLSAFTFQAFHLFLFVPVVVELSNFESMLKYTVFAFLAILFSCTSKPEETVAFDDLAPTSERYKEGRGSDTAVQVKVVDQRPASSLFLSIVDTLMDDSRWVKWDTVLYPDRFGPKKQEKWFTVGQNDSLVLLRYEFRDSSMTKNAFFNWLDCFGPKCKSYSVGDNIRIPRRSGLVLVGAKELIILEGGRSLDEMLIRGTLLQQLSGKKPDPKKENWLYIVSIPKSGKTTWKRIDKGEEKPIIRTNENS
jgi:hypothetical protein